MQINRLMVRSLLPGSAIACLLSGTSLLAQTLPLQPNLINFNSPEGEKLLLKSKNKQDYWPLSIQFVTQNSQAYCGVASMVMVLNALAIPAPVDSRYQPYRVFTQENFFDNQKTRDVISPELVSRQGITLDQLGQLLASYPVKVQVYHAAKTSLEQFRQQVMETLNQTDNFLLVNYLRKEINQDRGGHISPIAAYHKGSDRILILDVSRYKYPPVWVKTSELWRAMNTQDSVSGKTRGYVIVSRSN